MEHSAIFGFDPKIVSTVILVVSYLILFTEKLNRAVVALLGAVVMIFAGVLTQDGAIAGIDFNTLALLIGMMIIVGIAEKFIASSLPCRRRGDISGSILSK